MGLYSNVNKTVNMERRFDRTKLETDEFEHLIENRKEREDSAPTD